MYRRTLLLSELRNTVPGNLSFLLLLRSRISQIFRSSFIVFVLFFLGGCPIQDIRDEQLADDEVVDSRLQVAKQRKRGPAKQFCKLLKHWLIGIYMYKPNFNWKVTIKMPALLNQ